MLTLPTNTGNVAARIFAAFVVPAIGYLISRYGLHDPANNRVTGQISPVYLLYFLLALLLLIETILAMTLLGITRVTVDKTTSDITLRTFISSRKIKAGDIENYYQTKYTGKYRNYEGLLLQLRQGGIIQLAGQNLLHIPEFRAWLEAGKIPCKGNHRMLFPFR